MAIGACSNCDGKRLFKAKKPVSAGGGYAPNYLPGVGGFWGAAKFDVVVCQDCGLTRFFADPEARTRMQESTKWERV